MHSNIAIKTEGLNKIYNGTTALKSLDMKVPKHSIFGFLGPNGAGKTTTIKLLLGLIKPTAGGGTVFGHSITGDSVEIRRKVGYLAQVPSYYMYMTARETLRFKIRFYRSGPRNRIEERVQETLEMVELDDKADRQRVGMAQRPPQYDPQGEW